MVEPGAFEVRPIGVVSSALNDLGAAPRQGDEGAPDAWLVFEPEVAPALADLAVGAEVLVLTWLHHADRGVLSVHPRGEEQRPREGVFTTRSADRPNPIGLHQARVMEIDGLRVRVHPLEAIDGTPIVDLKPVLGAPTDR